LTSYTTFIEGKTIGAIIGDGIHYCGMSLKVWKSQSATVCLSCLPDFNVGNLQTDQMTCMANIMGMGIWTESGVDSLYGFKLTNQSGPTVDVTCESPTIGSLTSHYTTQSYLYWPQFFFAQTAGLCGLTHAYSIQDGVTTLVPTPDPNTSYWFVLVKVTSTASSHPTANRTDDSASPPKSPPGAPTPPTPPTFTV
jgi:hypothetical protein